MTSVDLAKMFHATYERLAPSYGYSTRPETQVFDLDTPNGKLMVAVCEEIWEKVVGDKLLQRLAEKTTHQKLTAERDKLAYMIEYIESLDPVIVWWARAGFQQEAKR